MEGQLLMISISRICSLGLLLVLQAVVAVRATESCAMSQARREELLALSFRQFDQEQGNGWRPIYANKCYRQAASLLAEYVKRNPDTARANYMLSFHAGQMFALAGEPTEAIRWMKHGYSDRPSNLINWNAFVDANVAFLKHDRIELLKQRELIDQEPPMADGQGVPKWAVGKKVNLDVVDGFVACFSETYEVAYGDGCRRRSSQLTN